MKISNIKIYNGSDWIDYTLGKNTVAFAENVYEKVDGVSFVESDNYDNHYSNYLEFEGPLLDGNVKNRGILSAGTLQFSTVQCDDSGTPTGYMENSFIGLFNRADFSFANVTTGERTSFMRTNIKINGTPYYLPTCGDGSENTFATLGEVYKKIEGLRLHAVNNVESYGSKGAIIIDGELDENNQRLQGLMAGKSFQMRKLQCDENGNLSSLAPGTQFAGMTWAEFGINDVDDSNKSTHYRIDKIKINGISHYFPEYGEGDPDTFATLGDIEDASVTIDTEITSTSSNPVSSSTLWGKFETKQDRAPGVNLSDYLIQIGQTKYTDTSISRLNYNDGSYYTLTIPEVTGMLATLEDIEGANNIKKGEGLGSIISASLNDDDRPYTEDELPVASGHETISFGKLCKATGKRSVSIGNSNDSSGNCSVVFGQNSKVSGVSSFVAGGNDNEILGNYCFTGGGRQHELNGTNNVAFGQDNLSEINTISTLLTGMGCKALSGSDKSLAGGAGSRVSSYASIAYGQYVESKYSNQAVFGIYNDNKENTLLEVGNGTQDLDGFRKNAFEVLKDSRAKVFGAPVEANDVVRLGDITYATESDINLMFA